MENKNELLHDVLQEAAPADFRAALLAETLGQVRRRQVGRQRNRAILHAACLIVAAIALWKFTVPQTGTPPLSVKDPVVDPLIILTQPMPAEMIVGTDSHSIEKVRTQQNSVAVIETPTKEILFKTIDDDELLTLLAGRPAVLVRPGPGKAELHFANPEDSSELFLP